MALRLLIDGYNLMNCAALQSRLVPQRDFQAQRDTFLRYLSQYQQLKGHQITVIFDAYRSTGRYAQRDRVGAVEVIYTPASETADDMIISMPKGDHSSLVIVSSDNSIIRSASAEGYAVISSDDFAARLFSSLSAPAAQRNAPRSERDVILSEAKDLDLSSSQDGKMTNGGKRKGPSHRLSKEGRKKSAILKKL